MSTRNPDRCPTHPGELLREDILPSLGHSVAEVAGFLGIRRRHFNNIIGGKEPVGPAVAVRLGTLFGNGPQVWLRMQAAYDLWHAQREVDVSDIPNLAADAKAGETA